MSVILPNLIVGSFHESFNYVATKHDTKITHVLNVASECIVSERVDLIYAKFAIDDDCPSADIRGILPNCVEFVKDAHFHNGVVFVHCLNGVSRSVCVVLAYLVLHCDMTFDDAYAHVSKMRPMIDVYPLYLHQLLCTI